MRASGAIAAATLAGVVLLLALEGNRTSPGALARVHAGQESSGADSCVQCHADADHSMSEACSTCHVDIGQSLADGRGLHGLLDPALAHDCSRCHAEHQGRGLELVGSTAFVRAGYPGPDGYRHEGLDFGLAGAHEALACERCHAQASVPVLPQGTRRFLGLTQSCTSCHADPHEDSYGNDCASCHGQDRPFSEIGGLDHAAFYPLVGAHADRACTECHQAGTPHAVSALVERHAASVGATDQQRDCLACHLTPHRDAFVEGVAARSAESDAGGRDAGTSCRVCHSAAHESFLGDHADTDRGWHAAAGFALEPPHDGLDCAACHPGLGTRAPIVSSAVDLAPFLRDFPGRAAADCQACHADPHASQFERGAFAGQGCLACHDRHTFLPAAFGVEQHARTSLPLTGAHLAVGCNACHRTPGENAAAAAPASADDDVRPFAGTPTDCAACHADVHAGRFDAPGRPAAVDGASSCARCHTTSTFSDASRGRFDHGLWTGYPLEGAHAEAACAACHAPSRTPDAEGRNFGRAAGTNCSDCHAAGTVPLDGARGSHR